MSDERSQNGAESRFRRAWIDADEPEAVKPAAARGEAGGDRAEPDVWSAFATEASLSRSDRSDRSDRSNRSEGSDRSEGSGSDRSDEGERGDGETGSPFSQFKREQVEPIVARLEGLGPIQAVAPQHVSRRASTIYGVVGLAIVAGVTLAMLSGLRAWLDGRGASATVMAERATPTAPPTVDERLARPPERVTNPEPDATPPAAGATIQTTATAEPSNPPRAEEETPPPPPVSARPAPIDVRPSEAPPRASATVEPSAGRGGGPFARPADTPPTENPLPTASVSVAGAPAPAVTPPAQVAASVSSAVEPRPVTATPAAASSPPASLAGAPTGGAAVTAPAPRAAIQTTLRRYADAFSALDAGRAKAVWPTVNERSLARAFAALEEQSVDLGTCEISVTGSTARASCEGATSYRPKVGSRSVRAEEREWTFRLQQNGSEWSIADVQTR